MLNVIKFPEDTGWHLVAHRLDADFFLENSGADCLRWHWNLDTKARLGKLRVLFVCHYQEFILEGF